MFGDYKMVGDPDYMLLYYPLNQDELSGKILGDPRWSGSTALHAAVVSGQAGIVHYLVDRGAKLDAKNKRGQTPLSVAVARLRVDGVVDTGTAQLLRELGATTLLGKSPVWPVLGPPQGIWEDIWPLGESRVHEPVYKHAD